MSEPRHNRGRSKQDYGTPWELIHATQRILDTSYFTIDYAATRANRKAPRHLDIARDALSLPATDWAYLAQGGWGWLNPPFANLHPWMQKAYDTAAVGKGAVAVLVPASVGSNWWTAWVHDIGAVVVFLRGRVVFEGQEDPYPKDCAVVLQAQKDRLNPLPWVMEGQQYYSWNWQMDGAVPR